MKVQTVDRDAVHGVELEKFEFFSRWPRRTYSRADIDLYNELYTSSGSFDGDCRFLCL